MNTKAVSALAFLFLSSFISCSNKVESNVEDGIVIKSGELTLENTLDALEPLVPFHFKEADTEGMIEENIEIDSHFTSFHSDFIANIEMTQSDRPHVDVYIPKDFKVKVTYLNGELRLENLEKNINININRNSEETVVINLCVPKVEKLELSGISHLSFTGDFIQSENLLIDISGCSGITSEGSLNVGNLKMDVSGCSKIEIPKLKTDFFNFHLTGISGLEVATCVCNNMKGIIDGTSQAKMKTDISEQLDIDISGSSKFDLNNEILKEGIVKISGISFVELTGSVDRLEASVTGASKLHVNGGTIKEGSLEIGGTSFAKLSGSSDYLKADLSGISKLDVSNLEYSSYNFNCDVLSKIKK